MSKLKTLPFLLLVTLLVLGSCQGSEKQATEEAIPPPKVYSLELEDKGLRTLNIDQETDYQRLHGINSFGRGTKQYFSFYSMNNRSIYLYDLDSLSLISKTLLASDGPNQVNMMFFPDYFFHTTDSIFVNTPHSGGYLVNTDGEVLATTGKASKSYKRFDRNLRTRGAGYLENNRVYAPIFPTFDSAPDVYEMAFGSIGLGEKEIRIEGVHSRTFIDDFEEMMDIRAQAKREKTSLIPMLRQFAAKGKITVASTAISDSLSFFKDNELVKRVYTGYPGVEMVPMKDYMYYRQMVQKPGEVGALSEVNQKPTFARLLISPNGRYVYRILINSTAPLYMDAMEKDMPHVTSATLVVLDVVTNGLAYFDLPVDEISIWVPVTDQVIATNEGVLFRVKEQENEDQVQMRLFGIKEVPEDGLSLKSVFDK